MAKQTIVRNTATLLHFLEASLCSLGITLSLSPRLLCNNLKSLKQDIVSKGLLMVFVYLKYSCLCCLERYADLNRQAMAKFGICH